VSHQIDVRYLATRISAVLFEVAGLGRVQYIPDYRAPTWVLLPLQD